MTRSTENNEEPHILGLLPRIKARMKNTRNTKNNTLAIVAAKPAASVSSAVLGTHGVLFVI